MKYRIGDLEFVRVFLQDLVDNTTETVGIDPSGIPDGRSWFRAGEGILTLSSEEHRQYQDVLEELIPKLAPDGDLSESTIDSALRDALFAAIDIQRGRDPNSSARVRAAVEKLKELASRKPETFECWLEVGGLDRESLPRSFGRVRFVHFSEYQQRRLYRTIRNASRGPNGISKSEVRSLVNAQKDGLHDSCFGIVECEARDSKAATTFAAREIRATVECLNFFSDLIPYNRSWLFLPGERESTGTTTMAVGGPGSFAMTSSHVGPLGGYSISQVASQKSISKATRRISKLLQAHSRNEVEELLLTSARWAGRATVSPLREEAFMLYAIALECLVLPGTDAGELRHRLSQRVARLTPGTVASRVERQKITKKLYDIRSKIVHSGHYEVGEKELYRIRAIAKRVIFDLLSNPRLASLSTTKALEAWYERQMLA